MRNGFTLIETIAALALAALVFAAASGLLMYSAGRHQRVMTETELLENARAADMFLREFLRSAEKVRVSAAADGSLRSLETVINGHSYTFRYENALPPNHVRYQRLDFSDFNEAASYIADIKAGEENGVLLLTVTTSNRLKHEAKPSAEPLTFVIAADMRDKDYAFTVK